MSIVNRVKGFVRSVSGIPPLALLDCVDEDSLINYTITGNSIQDGNPTPDNPIAIGCVGDLVTDGEDEHYGKYKIPISVNTETTINIYLDEPLRKIGDYADYIDFETQKVYRNVRELIITGDEDWSWVVTGSITRFIISPEQLVPSPMDAESYQQQLCNFFPCDSITTTGSNKGGSVYYSSSVGGTTFRVRYDNLTNLNRAKAFFKNCYDNGNPVKIYYQSLEPIEQTIILPIIPTFKGSTIYSIETDTPPSNMTATYYSTSKE